MAPMLTIFSEPGLDVSRRSWRQLRPGDLLLYEALSPSLPHSAPPPSTPCVLPLFFVQASASRKRMGGGGAYKNKKNVMRVIFFSLSCGWQNLFGCHSSEK